MECGPTVDLCNHPVALTSNLRHPSSATSLNQLKKRSVKSGGVTALSQGVNTAIHLGSTIVLARLLTPAEFGVVAMVMTVTVFAGLFKDLGLSAATIQRESLNQDQLSTLYWINVTAGAGLTLLLVASAPLVSRFYGRPELTSVTMCLALTFVISSFSTQQNALLVREMRFGRQAIASIVSSLIGFGLTMVLALSGLSYWSLVFGTLARSLTLTVMLNSFSGWRPGPPRRGTGVTAMLKYGLNLTGFSFVNYFSRNLDNVLIGRFAGADALGLYSRAYNLLMLPTSNLRVPMDTVAFPALSRLQRDPAGFRNYYRTITGVIAVASMPMVGYLFVASEPLIEVALGSQWTDAAKIFSILAIAAFMQPASGFRGTVLTSLGMARRHLHMGIVFAVITCGGFAVGVHWGAMGVATSYAITSVLLTFPMHALSFKDTPVSVTDFFESIAPPAIAAILAAMGAYGLRSYVLVERSSWVQVSACGVVYALLYLGALALNPVSRRQARQAIAFILEIVEHRRAKHVIISVAAEPRS